MNKKQRLRKLWQENIFLQRELSTSVSVEPLQLFVVHNLRVIISGSDMKGAPPRLPYLISLLPILSKAGATDLLLEYEDMFPFWGPLANISARNAYTIQDISGLLHAAKENNLTVIPLVQTFGHMEWVLKLERFKHLREEPLYPGSVCPSKDGGMDLLRLLLTQVMEVHTGSSHLHIGCDEVFQLGSCSQCVQRINKVNTLPGSAYYNTRMLFLDHVKAVASFVNRKGKVPIMWDDMLRNMPRSEIKVLKNSFYECLYIFISGFQYR